MSAATVEVVFDDGHARDILAELAARQLRLDDERKLRAQCEELVGRMLVS